MRFLLIEDDYMQSGSLAALLQTEFPGATVDLIETESSFYSALDRIAQANYDLIIIDVMLRWADASRSMPQAPPLVLEEGYEWAGVRCMANLKDDHRIGHVPILLYTVQGRVDLKVRLPDLPPGVTHQAKQTNGDEFTAAVKSALQKS